MVENNNMGREEVFDELISLYFKKSFYMSGNEITEEQQAFLDDNTFKAVMTEKTRNNGYPSHSKRANELCEVGKPYTVDYMDVGRSDSTLYLKEFPNARFNTVCFEYYIDND